MEWPMTDRFGLDYAWGTISPAEHKAVGSSFACRYLSYDPSKNITPKEADELRGGGISIVLVWETTANRALSGFAGGQSDAMEARIQANTVGFPNNRPIFFAIDFDASESQQAAINEYFRGVANILGVSRTGVYGGYWPVKRLFDASLVKYGWQTYAWSGGMWEQRAKLRQYSNDHTVAGVGCDYNNTIDADFGQDNFAGPTPPPVIITIPEDQNMIAATVSGNNVHVFVEVPHAKDDPTKGSVVYEIYQTGPGNWAGGQQGKQKALAYKLVDIPANVA